MRKIWGILESNIRKCEHGTRGTTFNIFLVLANFESTCAHQANVRKISYNPDQLG